jgi:hypothetical protein
MCLFLLCGCAGLMSIEDLQSAFEGIGMGSTVAQERERLRVIYSVVKKAHKSQIEVLKLINQASSAVGSKDSMYKNSTLAVRKAFLKYLEEHNFPVRLEADYRLSNFKSLAAVQVNGFAHTCKLK